MECRVCGAESNKIDPRGDYEEFACPACGPYKISRTAIGELERHGYRLDPTRTRKWLSQQTPETVPVIDSTLALQLAAS